MYVGTLRLLGPREACSVELKVVKEVEKKLDNYLRVFLAMRLR